MMKDGPDSKEPTRNHADIHFWVGMFVDKKINENLSDRQKEILRDCLVNPRKVSFEALKGYKNVFSIRYSKKGRFLLTVVAGKLIVLADLPTHDYSKRLKQLKSGLLKTFKSDDYSSEDLESLNFKALTLEEEPSDFLPIDSDANPFLSHSLAQNPMALQKACDEIAYKKVSLEFDDSKAPKVLVLDNDQEQALSVTMPALISGPPGSGKTTIALALLNHARSIESGKLLYTTHSKKLLHFIRQEFNKSATEDEKSKVDFYTYQQLMERQQEGMRFTTAWEFMPQWFESYVKELKKTEKNHATTTKMHALGWYTLYLEFRLLSGYDEIDYCDLSKVGKKESAFSSIDDRKWLAKAFTHMQNELKRQGLSLMDFCELQKILDFYCMVFVDEAQDFSNIQIKSIIEKMINSLPICFFFGDGQVLLDCMSNKIYIEKYFGALLSKINLKKPYRCPKQVLQIAHTVDQLRIDSTPKAKQENRIQLDDAQTQSHGHVSWQSFSKKNNHYKKALKALAQTINQEADSCVVVHEDLKQALVTEAGFNKLQLFTPEEVKGRQFSKVLIVEPFHDPVFKDIEKDFKNIQNLRSAHYSAPLSQLFVAITRAQHELKVLSSDHYQQLSELLKKDFHASTPYSSKTKASTADEWHDRAILEFRTGDFARGEAILKDKLGYSKQKINQFKDSHGFKEIQKFKTTQIDTSKPTSSQNNIEDAITKKSTSLTHMFKQLHLGFENKYQKPKKSPSPLKPNVMTSPSLQVQGDISIPLVDAIMREDITSMLAFASQAICLPIQSGRFKGSSALGLACFYQKGKSAAQLSRLYKTMDLRVYIHGEEQRVLEEIVRHNHVELLERLIKRGLRVNDYHQGHTLIHYAVMHESLDVLRCLDKYKVDVSLPTMDYHYSPLMMESEKGIDVVTPTFRQLVSMGANMNLSPRVSGDSDWTTPCEAMIQNRQFNQIRYCIKKGAKLNQTLEELGHTPFSLCLDSQNPSLIRELIDAGANIHLKFNNITLFDFTIMTSNVVAAKVLFEAGVHITQSDTLVRCLEHGAPETQTLITKCLKSEQFANSAISGGLKKLALTELDNDLKKSINRYRIELRNIIYDMLPNSIVPALREVPTLLEKVIRAHRDPYSYVEDFANQFNKIELDNMTAKLNIMKELAVMNQRIHVSKPNKPSLLDLFMSQIPTEDIVEITENNTSLLREIIAMSPHYPSLFKAFWKIHKTNTHLDDFTWNGLSNFFGGSPFQLLLSHYHVHTFEIKSFMLYFNEQFKAENFIMANMEKPSDTPLATIVQLAADNEEFLLHFFLHLLTQRMPDKKLLLPLAFFIFDNKQSSVQFNGLHLLMGLDNSETQMTMMRCFKQELAEHALQDGQYSNAIQECLEGLIYKKDNGGALYRMLAYAPLSLKNLLALRQSIDAFCLNNYRGFFTTQTFNQLLENRIALANTLEDRVESLDYQTLANQAKLAANSGYHYAFYDLALRFALLARVEEQIKCLHLVSDKCLFYGEAQAILKRANKISMKQSTPRLGKG